MKQTVPPSEKAAENCDHMTSCSVSLFPASTSRRARVGSLRRVVPEPDSLQPSCIFFLLLINILWCRVTLQFIYRQLLPDNVCLSSSQRRAARSLPECKCLVNPKVRMSLWGATMFFFFWWVLLKKSVKELNQWGVGGCRWGGL